MSSNGYRFKRESALSRAQVLLELLRPACEQIEIAGSLRRGKETVGDIEIVAQSRYEERVIPGQLDLFGGGMAATVEQVSLLDKRLEELIASGDLLRDRPHSPNKGRWGEKQKTLWTKIVTDGLVYYLQVDLFVITPPAQWGPIFTIRTGPEEFTGRTGLMAYINGNTKFQQADGRLIVRTTGEEIPTPTEQSYFEALGLPYIDPGDRTAVKLWQVVKTLKPRACGNGDQIHPSDQTPAPPANAIKALTLHQPWASLIAAGLKQYETRSWSASYRGPLAIHAGQQNGELDLTAVLTDKERAKLPSVLPSGAVVCLAHLVDVVKSEQIATDPEFAVSRESRLGNFAPGRYGWKLQIVKVFDPPIPARGAQGLWEWPMPIDEPPVTEFPAPEKSRSSGHRIQIDTQHCVDDAVVRAFLRKGLEERAEIA